MLKGGNKNIKSTSLATIESGRYIYLKIYLVSFDTKIRLMLYNMIWIRTKSNRNNIYLFVHLVLK